MAQDDWSWGHRLEALREKETTGCQTTSAQGHPRLSERSCLAADFRQSGFAAHESRGLRGAP